MQISISLQKGFYLIKLGAEVIATALTHAKALALASKYRQIIRQVEAK